MSTATPECGESGSAPIALSSHFCSLFQGVCAACPNGSARSQSPPAKPLVEIRLPPTADTAIASLARCRRLTKREVEVLTLVCTGLKNSVIAATLGVSLPTVRLHIKRLHHKTNTADKAELVLNLWHSCAASAAHPSRATHPTTAAPHHHPPRYRNR